MKWKKEYFNKKEKRNFLHVFAVTFLLSLSFVFMGTTQIENNRVKVIAEKYNFSDTVNYSYLRLRSAPPLRLK